MGVHYEESQPLVGTATAHAPAQSSRTRWAAAVAVTCALLAASAVMHVARSSPVESPSALDEVDGVKLPNHKLGGLSATKRSTSSKQGVTTVKAGNNMEVTYSSYYEKKLGVTIGDNMYERLYVEKHVDTEFFVEGSVGSASITIYKPNGEQFVHLTDEVGFVVKFEESGKFEVVFEDDETKFAFDVYSKSVRRELRDLDEADRVHYFNALRELYAVSESEGREKYGDKFHSANWMVRLHLQGAADKECDHWHDDAGFLNHHIGITMQMEQALQAVDSTTAAHYWDYTWDSKLYEDDFRNGSQIFYEDWYSDANPGNKYHVIDSGRWAFTRVMQNAQEFSDIHNPYGLLRSPWNTNPVPYVMRNSHVIGLENAGWHLPHCGQFEKALNHTESAPWMGYLQFELNGMLHGPVHIMLGGQWMMEEIENKTANVASSTLYNFGWDDWLLMSKELWREGWIRCPTTCSSDTPAKACMCSCPDEVRDGMTAEQIMFNQSRLSANSGPHLAQWHEKLGLTYDEIFDALCTVGHPGEMFSSAAPQDPVFWPLHGQAERYVQLLRLEDRSGRFNLTTTWGYEHSPAAAGITSDLHMTCDWSNTSGLEMPSCQDGVSCTGHREDDVLPFDNIFNDGKTYTNGEFWEATKPDSVKTDYVYDKLETWPGCSGGTFRFP